MKPRWRAIHDRDDRAAGTEGTKAAAAQHMARSFAVIEEHALRPGPFLCGPTFSAADIYLAMLVSWSLTPLALPRIKVVVEHVKSHPVLGPVWTRYALA